MSHGRARSSLPGAAQLPEEVLYAPDGESASCGQVVCLTPTRSSMAGAGTLCVHEERGALGRPDRRTNCTSWATLLTRCTACREWWLTSWSRPPARRTALWAIAAALPWPRRPFKALWAQVSGGSGVAWHERSVPSLAAHGSSVRWNGAVAALEVAPSLLRVACRDPPGRKDIARVPVVPR